MLSKGRTLASALPTWSTQIRLLSSVNQLMLSGQNSHQNPSMVTAPKGFLSHLDPVLVNVKVKVCSFSHEFLGDRSPYFQLE